MGTLQNISGDYPSMFMQDPKWITTEVLLLLGFLVALWLSISMIVHVFYSENTLHQRQLGLTGSLALSVAMCVAPLTVPRLIATESVLLVGFEKSEHNDFICEIAVDVSVGLFALASLSTYMYLWLRQRTFYLQPFLKRLYTKKIAFLNWTIGVFIPISAIATASLFVYPLSYESSNKGCVLRKVQKSNTFSHYVTTASLVVSQFTLLGLFIYPLVVQRKSQLKLVEQGKCTSTRNSGQPNRLLEMKTSSSNLSSPTSSRPNSLYRSTPTKKLPVILAILPGADVNLEELFMADPTQQKNVRTSVLEVFKRKNVNKSQRNQVKADRILLAIKRSLVTSFVCVFSDLLVLALQFTIPISTPRGITNAIYDISLLINVVSVFFSFENSKTLFAAPCISVAAKIKGK